MGKINNVAEIVGVAVMAVEIALMSALIAGHLVSSHDAFGRNR